MNVLDENRSMKAVLRERLTFASNCIDVGCGDGSMLSRIVRLAPAGRHIAFEPIPSKVELLRREFPEVDVRGMAISDRVGEMEFFENRSASGSNGKRRRGEGNFVRTIVPCTTLDEEIPRGRRFDLVKVDVAGSEWLVFRGARSLLERDRPWILFECVPTGPESCGHEPKDVLDLLRSYGYDVFMIAEFLDGGLPVEPDRFALALQYPFQAFNWIAAPRA